MGHNENGVNMKLETNSDYFEFGENLALLKISDNKHKIASYLHIISESEASLIKSFLDGYIEGYIEQTRLDELGAKYRELLDKKHEINKELNAIERELR